MIKALIVSTVTLAALVGLQEWRNGRVRDTLAETRSSLRSAQDASETQLLTIATLKKANQDCFKLIETSEQAQLVAVQQLREKEKQLVEASKNRKERIRVIRQNPDCDTLLNTDIHEVCPTLAHDLRQRVPLR